MTDDEPVLVDQPEPSKQLFATVLARPHAERRPIIPAALRNSDERRQLVRWWIEHWRHVAAYHATRAPLYIWRIAIRAPWGLLRILGALSDWLLDAKARPLIADAVNRKDHEAFHRIRGEQNNRSQRRFVLFIAGVVAVSLVATALWILAAAVINLLIALLALVMLGKIGSPRDKPLTDRAVAAPQVQKLTSDVVVRALGSLGISGINQALSKDSSAIKFTAPITRDGPGWRADIDLPHGVTCTDIIERRDRLASGLTRPLGCVWPEGNAEVHPGRLVLWVGDQDLSKTKQPSWPLLRLGEVDLFKPQPVATDQRGRWVHLTLMFVSVIIGAIPRMGKTFVLRELLLLAALDPRTELYTYDLKATGDLTPLDPVAHRSRVGDEPEDIDAALHDLRGLIKEMRRRAKVIRELPRELCPENKTTPELASRRSLGLHPIVIGVDECQIWFGHPEHGKEFEALCTDLVKRGPALGIILILATQRPDAKSLPTGISANAATRICLKVTGQLENDMVLGTSMYKAGVRATMFSQKRDKGVAILVGEGDEPVITRWMNIDGPTAEKVAARALAARKAAGTLTGQAAGDEDDRPQHDLLDDILRCVNLADGERIWSETICEHLAGLRPEIYNGWGPEQLAVGLKPYGIETVQINRKGVNRRGVDKKDVLAAIEQRHQNRALAGSGARAGGVS